MRKIILLLFTFVLVANANAKKKEPATVIITAGQSNTDGRVPNDSLPRYILRNGYKYCYWRYGSNERIVTGDGFRLFWPEVDSAKDPHRYAYDAVTYYWLDKLLKKKYYVIKWSLGGTAIDTLAKSSKKYYWSADKNFVENQNSTMRGGRSLLKSFCELIDNSIDTQLAHLPNGYEIKAFVWHQGESDGRGTSPSRYYDNLKTVVAYVRQHLVEKTGCKKYAELPFVFGTVSHYNSCYSSELEKAEYRLAKEDKNFHLIDLSSETLRGDRLHFNAQSTEFFGKQVYYQLKNIMNGHQ